MTRTVYNLIDFFFNINFSLLKLLGIKVHYTTGTLKCKQIFQKIGFKLVTVWDVEIDNDEDIVKENNLLFI